MRAKVAFRPARPAAFVLASGFLLASGVMAHAQLTPVGDEFQANTYTTGSQAHPTVGPDGAGGFVVVWSGPGAGTDATGGIHAQRFANTGAPIGSEFQVNTDTPYAEYSPAVGSDGAGGFVVVWKRTGSPSSVIRAQRFASTGVPVGAEFQVDTYGGSLPAVFGDGIGGFVVVWVGLGTGTDTSYGSIQGRLFSNTGLPVGDQFQINTYTSNRQNLPKVGPDGAGGFVVVWESYGSGGTDTSGYSVQAQRFASNGIPIGGEFQVNTYTTANQYGPDVGPDGTGGFVVTWWSGLSSGTDTSGYSVQAQRFASTGTPLGGQFQVNTYTEGFQGGAAVEADGAGGFVVVWHSEGGDGTDTYHSIRAQQFAGTGDPIGDEFQVNTSTLGYQRLPAMSSDGAGGLVVVWQSEDSGGTDSSQYSVQGQQFSVVTASTTTSTSISTSTTSSTLPALLGGEKLLLKDAPEKPQKRRLLLISKDPGVTVGDGTGGGDDPTMHGATLRIVSTAGDHFDNTYTLASGNWKPIKKKDPTKGWKFTKGDPIKKVLIKAGKLIEVIGKGSGLGHSLGADPNPVDAVLTMGTRAFCLQFGGTVKFRDGKSFLAKAASAPSACPTTTSTVTTTTS